jgi:hypothetical protein
MTDNNTTSFSFNGGSNKKADQKTKFIINQEMFLNILSKIEGANENSKIKLATEKIIEIVQNPGKDNLGILNISSNGGTVIINKLVLLSELDQIINAQTIGRAKYYITRLKKSLTEIKTSKINDLNLNRWKEYDDILTDSLWILDKRDNSGAHNAGYWGNFIQRKIFLVKKINLMLKQILLMRIVLN